MAEAQTHISQTLAEEKDEKPDTGTNAVEVKEVENPVNAASEEVATGNAEAAAEKNTDVIADATEEKISGVNPIVSAGESTEASSELPSAAAAEESSETTEDNSGDQEVAEETPEIKIETAPADIRFPTTNQTRHCFTRYIEYHRCTAAKGDGAPECDKFAKYYRSMCPGEWIEQWNEQRENGTFPGPL